MTWVVLASFACLLWLGLLIAPWQPWRIRERLEAAAEDGTPLEDVTALVPARDEASVIAQALRSLRSQGRGLRIIVIDDGSSDSTAAIARSEGAEVLAAGPLPEGWAGKLWALEQGRRITRTSLILLLDADIVLRPGTLAAMRRKLRREGRQLVSLMARLHMSNPWECLLMPAFIYFFRLLYPFRLANGPWRRFAAAAGGCILLEAAAVESIGGFASLRNALIDDCTLAQRIKRAGGRGWIGLTHSASSLRVYGGLGEIWNMVARSAFTQLRYSTALLLLCSAVMGAAFGLPLASLAGPPSARLLGLVALAAMMASYLPTLSYYRLSPWWCLALPVSGGLFLAMTWTSAWRYWRGERSRWKGRAYQRS